VLHVNSNEEKVIVSFINLVPSLLYQVQKYEYMYIYIYCKIISPFSNKIFVHSAHRVRSENSNVICDDVSCGLESVPIRCVNDIDSSREAPKCIYLLQSVEGPGKLVLRYVVLSLMCGHIQGCISIGSRRENMDATTVTPEGCKCSLAPRPVNTV
jgi:hypothetical protein